MASPPKHDFAPIFIVGCPRSGTTLLTVLLDRHDRIAMTPETHFLDVFGKARAARVPPDHESLVDFFLLRSHLCDLRLDREDLLRRFRGDEPTFEAFFRRALEAFAARAGKPRCGEKTPLHIFDVPQILDWFPDAKILWLLRDGRDSVQAMIRCELFHKDRRRSCHLWRSTVLAGLAWEARYPENVLRVRFEDLILDPRKELGRVCEFIGVEFQEGQLDPDRRSCVVLERELRLKARANESLDPAKVGEYARQTTEREKWLMDSVMATELARLGYPPTEARRPPPAIRAGDAILNAPLALLYHPHGRRLWNVLAPHYDKLIGRRRRLARRALANISPPPVDVASEARHRSEPSLRGPGSEKGTPLVTSEPCGGE